MVALRTGELVRADIPMRLHRHRQLEPATPPVRQSRKKTGKQWARYGLKRVNKERTGGINWNCADSNGLASSSFSHG